MTDWDFDSLSILQWTLLVLLVVLFIILLIILGCAWKYDRRYRELAAQHDRLAKEKRIVLASNPVIMQDNRHDGNGHTGDDNNETLALKHGVIDNTPHIGITGDMSDSNVGNVLIQYHKSQPTIDYGNEHHIHDINDKNDKNYAGSDVLSNGSNYRNDIYDYNNNDNDNDYESQSESGNRYNNNNRIQRSDNNYYLSNENHYHTYHKPQRLQINNRDSNRSNNNNIIEERDDFDNDMEDNNNNINNNDNEASMDTVTVTDDLDDESAVRNTNDVNVYGRGARSTERGSGRRHNLSITQSHTGSSPTNSHSDGSNNGRNNNNNNHYNNNNNNNVDDKRYREQRSRHKHSQNIQNGQMLGPIQPAPINVSTDV